MYLLSFSDKFPNLLYNLLYVYAMLNFLVYFNFIYDILYISKF